MPRVLLCHQPTDGGVGRHVADIARGLAARGFEVTLFSPAPPSGLDVPVDHIPADLRRAVSPRADARDLAALSRAIARVRPQIVHAHSSKAGALARLARVRHPRMPVLYTPHGYAFAGHFSREAERRAYRLIERALAPLASRVVCVCEAEAQLARSVGPNGRVRVVHNGIDPLKPVAPAPALAALGGHCTGRLEAGGPEAGGPEAGGHEAGRRGPVIGALTLLRPGKGLETLIEAAPLVLERHPGAAFVIVGEGPDLAALRAQASAFGVAQAVHFIGPCAEPAAVLGAIDVFVHPSWAESFPYVVLEAMSLARPIVASRVGGIPEAVTDGESALLVPPRDGAALAGALIKLLDDPVLADRLARAAHERLVSRFTREAMIDGLVGVYEELL